MHLDSIKRGVLNAVIVENAGIDGILVWLYAGGV